MELIRKIDIHAHISPYPALTPVHPKSGLTTVSGEELITMYDQLGIEYGVLQPIVSPEGMRFTTTNEAIKIEADKYPDRFFWFCNIDPRAYENTDQCDLSHLLRYYKSLGARGLGEVTSNLYLDDPKTDNLFHHCEECALPVLLHIDTEIGKRYGVVDDSGLPRLEKMLRKHPNLKFIGHSCAFWDELAAGSTIGKVEKEGRLAQLLRTYENLYCDLSGGSGMRAMTRDPEYTVAFITEFQDRILYGCDIGETDNVYPFQLRDFLDGLYLDGRISSSVYRKISRGNAEQLLCL